MSAALPTLNPGPGHPTISDMSTSHGRVHTHVTCPGCDAVIRVPTERLSENPRCPKCKGALFTGKPIELNGPTFDVHVSKTDVPVVVDFWAPWCGPCHAMAPHFAAAAHRLEPRFRFAKVNTDEEPDLGQRFGIRSIPTLIVFRGGKPVARQSGAMDSAALARWLEQAGAGGR
jgi:thioredoxin 2